MLASRALVLVLIAGCSPELMRAAEETPRLPAYVGPPLGQSTAMGPADSTRPLAMSRPAAPEDVGPGMRITAPGPGAPPPAQTPSEAPAVAPEQYSGLLYAPYGPNGPVAPIVEEPPPPVFQPPPPPPPPDLSDRVMSDEGEG